LFVAKIIVTLRKSILDPQGKAVRHALESLSMSEIRDIRMGRFIEMKMDAPDEITARKLADEACRKLLANPVMEDYSFMIESVGGGG
jgi:phosphoribosylformylglycinamidine synthase